MIAGERQKMAHTLKDKVSHQGESQLSLRDHLDDILLHPVFGYFLEILGYIVDI